ncbi:MAG: DUF4340 domain-containing protein [Oscillospiraceae bacterium]|nr:DUF4340 domain-containing protein [Oscillospiraceae bacterium]
MTKRIKGLLASVAVLAVLGGGLTALLLTNPDKQDESSTETEDLTTELWHAHADDISRIEVSKPEGSGDSFAANRKITQTEVEDSEGGTTTEEVTDYVIEGYEALPMAIYQTRLLASRAPELSSVSTVVEHATEADKYAHGFENAIKVKYVVDNADPIIFYVGNISTKQGCSYLMLENDDRIFMVDSSAVEMFRKDIEDFIGTALTDEFDSTGDVQIESVRLHRTNLPYDIYCEYDKYTAEHDQGGGSAVHVMKEPIPCLLSPDKSSKVTHGLYNLNATDVVQTFPSENDMEYYGLKEPFATVTMKTSDGKTTVFRLGNTYETADNTKLYYGYLDSVDCIYGFSVDNTAYATVKAEDITSKVIVDSYVWDIGKLTYEADGKKWEFSGKGSSSDDYLLSYNGNSVEDKERYRLLYTYLLKASAEDLILEEPEISSTPMASVSIEEQNDGRKYKVDFYDAGGIKAYIAVDGRVLFSCRKAYVTTLIENLNMFDDESKEFIMSW